LDLVAKRFVGPEAVTEEVEALPQSRPLFAAALPPEEVWHGLEG